MVSVRILAIAVASVVGANAVETTFVESNSVETIRIDGVDIQAARDEVLVYLAEDVTQDQLDAIKSEVTRLSIRTAFDKDLRMFQLIVGPDTSEEDVIRAMESLDGVIGAGLNEVARPDRL